jgi:hypothetical protein
MKTQTKKIIAREGWVLIGIGLLGIILCWSGAKTGIRWENYTTNTLGSKFLIYWAEGTLGVLVLLFGYPTYLLIRFILWAVRTLKQK